jgi:HTH-type transcriptional regulator / antitoxin HigA
MIEEVGKMTVSNSEYLKLLEAFPPRPIKNEEEYCATQSVLDALFKKGKLTPDEEDYLDLLGGLIYFYEEQHVVIADIRGIELIKALLVEENLRQKDLVSIFKTESIVSAVLNGRRKLTVEHIRKLSKFFNLPPELFLESDWADEVKLEEESTALEADEMVERVPHRAMS